MTTDDEDAAVSAYAARWNAFRRKTMVLTAPELLELVGLLRELDGLLACGGTDMEFWDNGNDRTTVRARLEKLLGLHPGELDTKRRVCVESAGAQTPREGDRA